MNKKKTIIIVTVLSVFLLVFGSYFLFFKTDFYKRGEVLRLMNSQGDLFTASVAEKDRISEKYMNIEAIQESAAYTIKEEDITIQYITTTQAKELFPKEWRERDYEELVREFGKETVDGAYKYKDIEGLYVSFFNGFGNGYCVQIESEIFNELFQKTPVTEVYDSDKKIFYSCYERVKVTDYEVAGIFYSKVSEPEKPSGTEGITTKTKYGYLYKSHWMKDYIEKIEGNFYYYNQEGHDPI